LIDIKHKDFFDSKIAVGAWFLSGYAYAAHPCLAKRGSTLPHSGCGSRSSANRTNSWRTRTGPGPARWASLDGLHLDFVTVLLAISRLHSSHTIGPATVRSPPQHARRPSTEPRTYSVPPRDTLQFSQGPTPLISPTARGRASAPLPDHVIPLISPCCVATACR